MVRSPHVTDAPCDNDVRETEAAEAVLREIRWTVGDVEHGRLRPGHVHGRLMDGPHFAFLAAGRATLRAGDDPRTVEHPRGADTDLDEVRVSAGDFLLLPRGGAIRIRAEGDEMARFVTGQLRLDGGAFHQVTRLMPASLFNCARILHDGAHRGLFQLIDGELGRQRAGSGAVLDRVVDLAVSTTLRSWLEQCCVSASAWLVQLRDPRLGRALEAMHADPGHAWTVESLARLAHTSRSQFAGVFHDLIGQTPARYLTGVRMRRAEDLLRAGWSVSRVAVQLGYESDEGFRRAFRRHTGLAPTAWLRTAPGDAPRAAGAALSTVVSDPDPELEPALQPASA